MPPVELQGEQDVGGYARMFGAPPTRDAETLRVGGEGIADGARSGRS